MNIAVKEKEDCLLRRSEVMKLLRIKSATTFYHYLQNGKIPKGIKIPGGITLFWRSDILNFLDSLKNPS